MLTKFLSWANKVGDINKDINSRRPMVLYYEDRWRGGGVGDKVTKHCLRPSCDITACSDVMNLNSEGRGIKSRPRGGRIAIDAKCQKPVHLAWGKRSKIPGAFNCAVPHQIMVLGRETPRIIIDHNSAHMLIVFLISAVGLYWIETA